MNDNLVELMRNQVNKELESAYLYLEFANFFTQNSLNGYAHWYRVQAKEEIDHALKFIDYLNDAGMAVCLRPVGRPQDTLTEMYNLEINGSCDVSLIPSILKSGLNHEMYITALIEKILSVAQDCNDYRATRFLELFIDEQTEEEKNAMELLNNYTLFACDCRAGLLLTDKRLAKRKDECA